MSDKSVLIAVVVALIGAGGIVAAKYLEVGAKTQAAPAPQPAPNPTPAPGPAPTPGPAPAPVNVDPTPTPKPVEVAPVVTTVPAAMVPDISGPWHDIEHATYVIAQQGGAIRITSPQFTGTFGAGTVIGNAVQWDYRDSNGVPGRCAGIVLDAQLQVVCTALGINYPFPMHRPNSG